MARAHKRTSAMKRVSIIGCITVLVSSAAFAQQALTPTLYTPDAKKYDHVGKMVYYPGKMKNLLEGRNDVYHAGDYDCLPGDEHNAPDCRKLIEWKVWEQKPKTVFTLEDGKTLEEVETVICPYDDNFCQLASNWETARTMSAYKTDSVTYFIQSMQNLQGYNPPTFVDDKQVEGTFLYRIVRKKHDPGVYSVIIDYVMKQLEYYEKLNLQRISSVRLKSHRLP
jgi:hypothetical protein